MDRRVERYTRPAQPACVYSPPGARGRVRLLLTVADTRMLACYACDASTERKEEVMSCSVKFDDDRRMVVISGRVRVCAPDYATIVVEEPDWAPDDVEPRRATPTGNWHEACAGNARAFRWYNKRKTLVGEIESQSLVHQVRSSKQAKRRYDVGCTSTATVCHAYH